MLLAFWIASLSVLLSAWVSIYQLSKTIECDLIQPGVLSKARVRMKSLSMLSIVLVIILMLVPVPTPHETNPQSTTYGCENEIEQNATISRALAFCRQCN